MSNSWVDSLLAHYETCWGACAYEARWRRGPHARLPECFRVAVFEPNAKNSQWIYATCGMSRVVDPTRLELHLVSPVEYSGHLELLTAVADFYLAGHPLDLGATVNFGRGWLPDSLQEYGLISRPYLYGPSLEEFTEQGTRAKCYWLLPITKSERDFKKDQGLEVLESLFDEKEVEYWNPHRPPVV